MYKLPIESSLENFLYKINNFKKDYFYFVKSKVFFNIKYLKRELLHSLMNHVKTKNSLALYDEKFFDVYIQIIKSYKSFLKKYEVIKKNLNEDINKNLLGLISVLKSQISLANEKGDFKKNPIFFEKKEIMEAHLNLIYNKIEQLKDIDYDYFNEAVVTENLDFKDSILEFFKEQIGKVYLENLLICFNSINDTHKRKVLNEYNNILQEEIEILSSIIKVQITALEKLCETNGEKELIWSLLKPIREAYQHTSKDFINILKEEKTVEPITDVCIEKEKQIIVKFFNDNLKDFNIKENLDIFYHLEELVKNTFKEALSVILKSFQSSQISLNETKNIFENTIFEFKLLNSIIDEKLDFYTNSEFSEIVLGIFETIDIKIQNLEESNFYIIYEQFYTTLKELENINFENFEYNKDEIFAYVLNSDFENLKIFMKNQIIDANFSKYENFINKFNKTLENFIKDTIFFEISTFEDIINHSVNLIKNSENEDFTSFIDSVEKAILNIQNTLISNGVEIIKPLINTLFNGKEHEILMVEESETLKKGQIIKVINSGYKICDKVIIRANVIVAR